MKIIKTILEVISSLFFVLIDTIQDNLRFYLYHQKKFHSRTPRQAVRSVATYSCSE